MEHGRLWMKFPVVDFMMGRLNFHRILAVKPCNHAPEESQTRPPAPVNPGLPRFASLVFTQNPIQLRFQPLHLHTPEWSLSGLLRTQYF
jgi:hypothetical protein